MENVTQKRHLIGLVVSASFLVTLFITPSYSSEPVDQPKLFLLTPIAFAVFGLIASRNNISLWRQHKLAIGVLAVFLFQMVLVLFFADSPFNQQFFGTLGRNTGFLCYLSLVFLFAASLLVSSVSLLSKLSLSLLGAGIISAFYGLLQTFAKDPIHWNNGYNPIITFLGNPDFASSFLGFSSAIATALIISKKTRLLIRTSLSLYLIFDLWLIFRTHAQQGVLVFVLSNVVVFGSALYKSKKVPRLLSHFYALSVGIVGTLVILGIFKIGPLSAKLYKLSVRQRGFYWHAALQMMKSNPLFGVGFDSYGDNYFKYRSSNAAFKSAAVQSNAAHNVFLDIGSNGGVLLFSSYIFLNILVLLVAIRTIKRMQNFDPMFVGLFGAWIGYQAQSIVSINQIGLAVWGWVIGGALLGYGKISQLPAAQSSKPKLKNYKGNMTSNLVPATLGMVLGLLLTTPMFVSDHNFRTAQSARNANLMIQAVKGYPEDLNRTLAAASIFASNNLRAQGLDLAKQVAKSNANSYNAWELIYQLSPVGTKDANVAYANMQKLNPHLKKIN